MKIDPGELVSITQAAKLRGVSFQAIQDLIKRGKFTAIEVGGKKYLFRKEVEAFVPRRTGRPRKDAAAKSPQSSKPTKSAKKKKSR